MRLFITSDANAETRIGEAIRFSPIAEYWFKGKEYGSGLDGICVVVTCRNPDLKLKQRIRLSVNKKSPPPFTPFPRKSGGRYFDMDLMLDYNEIVKHRNREQYSGMISAALRHTDKEREQLIRQRVVEEVPTMLRNYATRRRNPLKDFDVDRFEEDLRECLLGGGLEGVRSDYEVKVVREREARQRQRQKSG